VFGAQGGLARMLTPEAIRQVQRTPRATFRRLSAFSAQARRTPLPVQRRLPAKDPLNAGIAIE
jgi:hypothetical protein